MVEGIAAWFCLLVGIITGEASWYIASGVFAVALQICRLVNEKEGRD
jgi:hypothetical protein